MRRSSATSPLFVHLAERLGDLLELVVEQQEDLAFDRVGQDEVVDLGGVALAVAVDAPDALLDVHRVPRQVEVEQNASVLEVDAFPARRRADHAPSGRRLA